MIGCVSSMADPLAERLNFCKRLLKGWKSIAYDRKIAAAELEPLVKLIAVALKIKANRQFQTVIELCERNEAEDAMVIARCMFDNLLAFLFITRPSIRLRQFTKKGVQPLVAKNPNRLFRTRLYTAYCEISDQERYQRLLNHPKFAKAASWCKPLVDPTIEAGWEKQLGKAWIDRIKNHPFTYSGLSIRSLANSLGTGTGYYYDLAYPIQSDAVHAADALNYVENINGVITSRLESLPHRTLGALEMASLMYLGFATEVSKRFNFGISGNTLIRNLYKEHKQLLRAKNK